MRVRHKPWAKGKLEADSDFVISNPEYYRSNWQHVFQNNAPIHLEIGTGKGRFITMMAKQHPEINFIGMEQSASILVDALDKCIDLNLPNVRLLHNDAQLLNDFFAEGDIQQIYLNFSDPWPKNRHEKRRLTYKSFLKQYKTILKEQGELHMKTDNQALFEYSLESFSTFGLTLQNISLDLHKEHIKENVMTEYEKKFSSKGQRIYRCEVVF